MRARATWRADEAAPGGFALAWPSVTRYFEDFTVGEAAVSPRRTVAEADVHLFAGLSGDFHPLHMDQVHAEAGALRRRVAHGALVFSLASGLSTQMAGPGEAGALEALLGIDEMRFLRPVFFGDTLQVRKRVAETELKDAKRGLVRFETTVVNQEGQAVLTYFDLALFRRREPGPVERRAGKETS